MEASDAARHDSLAASDRARDAALVAMEKRLDGMNEFRQQLGDQTKHFITRPEHDRLDSDIKVLRERIDRGEGTQSGRQTGTMNMQGWAGVFVGIAGVAIAAVALMSAHSAPANPTIGADTQRVNDLIVQENSRFDALSRRLDQLTGPAGPGKP